MGSACPRRVLVLALALATVALAGARDVARKDVDAPPEDTGGFTRTEGPRRALAQWTLPPRRALPSPEDLRLPWQTSPRAAASAAMGSDHLAPLGGDGDDHETDGIPTPTSLATDYDELDADYFARRTDSKITDPLEQQLARWYRTTDELEAPLPESRRVEEVAEEPTETDDASPRTDGLDRGDESAIFDAAEEREEEKPKPPSSREDVGANATSFSTSTSAPSEMTERRGDARDERAGEALGWRKEAEAARKEEEKEEAATARDARRRPRDERTDFDFEAVELFYADVTDPRRPVGEAIYEGQKTKRATESVDDASKDAFEPTAEELERDEAEYRAWAAARRAAETRAGVFVADDVGENGESEKPARGPPPEADAVVDAIVADAEALRERARKVLNATSAPRAAGAARDAAAVRREARVVASRVARDAEDRGAGKEAAAEAIAATAMDDDSARRAIIAAARRAMEETGELPRGVTPEDIARGDVESDAESTPAEKARVPAPNATASSDGNRRRTPALGAARLGAARLGAKRSRSSKPSGTDHDLESNMFAAYSDLKHESQAEEDGKAKAKAASAAKASSAATAKSSESSSTESSSSKKTSSKKTSKSSKASKTPREDVSSGTPPTGPLLASEKIDAEMAALVAAAKSNTDAERRRSEPDSRADETSEASGNEYVAAVGTVISQHDFGEDIRETSAEILRAQRTEERVASTRAETAAVFVVAVFVVGSGFASLRRFLLLDRERLDSTARDEGTAGPTRQSDPASSSGFVGAEGTAGEDGKDVRDAVSPASGEKPRRRSKGESAPTAKTPTKRGATASPRAREKTPLLPK